jgi:hypothetical protein
MPGPELTQAIKAAGTWAELQTLHNRVGPYMNHIHISAMLCHLAQLATRRPAASLEPPGSSPPARSQDMQLRPGPLRLAHALLQAMHASMPSFEARQVRVMIHVAQVSFSSWLCKACHHDQGL